MKIVYIHQYFLTQEEGGAIRSYYISQALKNKGHEVHIITAHNKTSQEIKIIDGTTVHYLPVSYDNSFGVFKRIKAFLSFAWKAYSTAKSIEGVELVYATSTPLSIGLIALMLKKFKSLPYVFEVRDLWPEAPIQLGYLNNSLLQGLAKHLEKTIYDNAKHIVALSPGMADGVIAITQTPVTVIPNMSDCDFFQPMVSAPSPVVITYFGAIGKVNRMGSLVELANYAQENYPNEYKFIVAGKGSELAKMQLDCKNLTNIVFKGHLNKEGIKELLEKSHVSYISFGPQPILETNSPNKFFDSIAMGKLCVITTKGWIKELIKNNRIGFYYNCEDPKLFFENLEPLCNSASLESISARARDLALHNFEKNTLAQQAVSVIEMAALSKR
jgi:glycosyltransferase involved in cell wall biosynthesis